MTTQPAVSTAVTKPVRPVSAGTVTVSHARRNRRVMHAAVAFAVIGGLGAGAWSVRNWARRGGPIDKLTLTSVERRDFSVILKEKGELKAANSTDIICEVEGRSTIISLIPEGTAVNKGDLLIELASNEIDDRIRQEELKEANAITAYESAKTELEIQRDKNASDVRKAQLEIELKQLELEKYQKGDWQQSIKDAQIAIDQALITLERRKQDFEAAKELRERDFITQTEYDEDEFNYQKAIWDLEKAERAKEVLESYTHVADSRRKESDVAEATKEAERIAKNAEAEETKKVRALEGREKELALNQDELKKLRLQKEKCRIFAPTQGFVVYYTENSHRWGNTESQIREGAQVHERQVLMQLPDTSSMVVELRIHEAKTEKIRLDQRAVVNVEGVTGRQFTGRVSKIAAVADSQGGWLNPDLKEYETEILLDQADMPLKPGVTAHTEILVKSVEDALAVPVQAIYSKSGKRYVFKETNGVVSHSEIQLGAVGEIWAEISGGLAEHDEILLAFNDTHKRLIPEVSPGGRPGAGGPRRAGGDVPEGDKGSAPAPVTPAGSPAAGQPRRPADGRARGGGRPGGASAPAGASRPASTGTSTSP